MRVHKRGAVCASTLLRFILCPLACAYIDRRLIRVDWLGGASLDAAPKARCSENPRPDVSALAETALPRSTAAEPLLASSHRALPVWAYYTRVAWCRYAGVMIASILLDLAPAFACSQKTAGCSTGNARCGTSAALRITAAPLATAAITAAPRATAAIALPAKWRSSSKH